MEQRVVVGTWPTTAYRLSRLLESCPPGAEVAVVWGEAPADRFTAVRDHDVASRLARRLADRLPIGTTVAVSWRVPGCRASASARPATATRRAPHRGPMTPARRQLREYGVRALRAVNPDPPMKGVPADG
jgi:hypothetical protein